ncbi:MAG TPA: hypothetical protein VGF82_00370 [Terracidiphilus sp.]|jgi:hypothetical protein
MNSFEEADIRNQQGRKRVSSGFFSSLMGFALLSVSTSVANCQQGTTNALPNRPIVIPNRSLSPSEMKELADKNTRSRNFNAANVARKQLIDGEANKLLILAKDLKAKTEGLGSDRPSSVMLREAAMIEFLANDVKEKMKLTVNPD